MKKALLIGFILLVLLSCQPQTVIVAQQPVTETEQNVQLKTPIGLVSRFVDYEAGVVCYAIETTSHKGTDGFLKDGVGLGVGLSCLPVSQTKLSKE